jgi:hypothetical protein
MTVTLSVLFTHELVKPIVKRSSSSTISFEGNYEVQPPSPIQSGGDEQTITTNPDSSPLMHNCTLKLLQEKKFGHRSRKLST